MSSARRWWTRANALTALRLLAAPCLFAAVSQGRPALAAVIFAVAVATDFADGWVARRYGEASGLGGFADHAVDATFVTVGTTVLALRGALPAALPVLIAAAFLQYALDSRLMAVRGLHGSALGRWNGIAYYVAVGVPVVRDGLGLGWPGPTLVSALGWTLIGSTLLSMGARLRLLLVERRARGSAARGRAGRSPR